MQNLIHLAALTLAWNANAQPTTTPTPYKIECYSSDRATRLEGGLNAESPVRRLTSLMVVDHKTVHQPVINSKTFKFFFDSSLIQINGTLADGKTITFAAQPSVADSKIWIGTLNINDNPVPVTCDLL